MKRTKKRKSNGVKYPYIGVRPSKPLEDRIKKVAEKSHRKVSALMVLFALRGLPEMERELGLPASKS